MVASARLTLGGFLARYAFAVLVVGTTYNPTPYSYYAWVRSTGYEWRPPTVFVGVVLLIGWFIGQTVQLAVAGAFGGAGLAGTSSRNLLLRAAGLAVLCFVLVVALQSAGAVPSVKLD